MERARSRGNGPLGSTVVKVQNRSTTKLVHNKHCIKLPSRTSGGNKGYKHYFAGPNCIENVFLMIVFFPQKERRKDGEMVVKLLKNLFDSTKKK